MLIKIFKSKIHRATVTEANLTYEGSLSIDYALMKAADIIKHEAVWVWNINNGERLMTYAIEGEENSGVICLNGSAARLGHPGDLVIITTFADMTILEAKEYHPIELKVDDENKIIKRTHGGTVTTPGSKGIIIKQGIEE